MDFDPALLAFATPDELAIIEEELKIEEALSTPLDLAVYASEANAYAHVQYINTVLVAMFDHRLYKSGIGPKAIMISPRKWVHPVTGEKALSKIAIKCPPRHGKSFLVSHHLPAWFLYTNPDLPVILASYEADFAAEWGEKVRDLIEEHPELGLNVNKDARSKANWRLKGHTGGMFTAGAGGPVTGKGAGLLIIDDPVKNAEEALSASDRQKKDDWYQSTFRTRGNKKGNTGYFTVLMYTPWHEDDLGGRISKREGDDWFEVIMPAISYDTVNEDGISIDTDTNVVDPIGRGPGEALCPDLSTLEELREMEEGSRQWFAAMFQCKPNIQGGGIFKRESFNFYKKIDRTLELTDRDGNTTLVPESQIFMRFGIADMAATERTRSDFTVVGVFAVTRDHKLIVEKIYKRKLEAPDHEAFVREVYVKHNLRFLGVEDQTYGKALIQHLIRGGGVVVRKLSADRDKISRAIPAGMMVDNGQLYLPRDADWIADFIDDLVKFPNAAHDDQVDVLAYAVWQWERLPKYRDVLIPDNSMQARLDRHLANLTKKKKSFHPELGRW